MNYQRFFEDAIDQLHAERRYRVFADLERIVGKFPRAIWRANGRAQALQSAEQAAAAEQGREQRRRFLTPGSGYQPGNARMFPNSGN